jgi:hypothetical protein
MGDRILLVCCTMRRPDRIQEMIKSYRDTKGSDNTDIIYCLDNKDKRLYEYEPVLRGEKVIIESPNYQTKMFNIISKELYTDYDYYGLINDDHIFRTKNWDIELVQTVEELGNGFGLAHANALWYDSDIVCRHPSAFIISANIIRVLDYAIYPELRHFKLDTYFRDLTEPLGLLFFREDIVIEHMHRDVGKAEDDENYKWGYSGEEMAHGNKHYFLWSKLYADNNRYKIARAIKESIAKGKGKGDGKG